MRLNRGFVKRAPKSIRGRRQQRILNCRIARATRFKLFGKEHSLLLAICPARNCGEVDTSEHTISCAGLALPDEGSDPPKELLRTQLYYTLGSASSFPLPGSPIYGGETNLVSREGSPAGEISLFLLVWVDAL